MSQGDADTERVAVTVRVPAYQKEAWVAEADRLDMSQSEFVRTMVQAGRRDLGIEETFGSPSVADDGGTDDQRCPPDPATDAGKTEGRSDPSPPRGDGLEDRLLGVLDREGVMSFEGLVEAVAGDVEGRVDDAMAALQSRGRVRYSGRDGGYVVVER